MSLLGIAPLGVYVVLHLWTNLSSLGGPESYNAALAASRRHPAFLFLEVLLGLAILAHTVVGVRLMLRWRPNNLEERTFGNLKFLLPMQEILAMSGAERLSEALPRMLESNALSNVL